MQLMKPYLSAKHCKLIPLLFLKTSSSKHSVWPRVLWWLDSQGRRQHQAEGGHHWTPCSQGHLVQRWCWDNQKDDGHHQRSWIQHPVCQGCWSHTPRPLHCGGYQWIWKQEGEHPCSSPRYAVWLFSSLCWNAVVYIVFIFFYNFFLTHLHVVDTPGEPIGPIVFSQISEGKCTLSWTAPENDGCSEISHYIIEKRETAKISWALVSDECKECTFNASKLIKTNEYQFRVSAVNKFGVGRPLESSPIIAQLQYSKCKVGKFYMYSIYSIYVSYI